MANPKIQSLRNKATHRVTIKDENLGEVEWVIRSIPAYDLLQHYDIFQGLPEHIQMDPENMKAEDIKLIKTKILPMMEVVVPVCVIDPPVTLDRDDPRLVTDEAIHLREIGFGAITQLFEEIMKLSGMTKEAEEARKKLQGASSPPQ